MKTYLPKALLIFFLFSGTLTAQTTDKFGTAKLEQLTMTSYPLDKLAEAVVLSDIGDTYFEDTDYGFRTLFQRTTRIKVLSKAGLKYATVEIPYYFEDNVSEIVLDIDGYTYNIENGLISQSRFQGKPFDEKINEHWMVKKFVLPDVQEGSVIEFTYKIKSPYFFNLQDWEFQRRIPTIYSEYTVRMTPFYEYSYIFQGASKFDVYKNTESTFKRNCYGLEFPDNIFTFGMKNIPAFRDEEYITSINDYIMKMDFQLAVIHHQNGAKVNVITTWPLLIEDLLKSSDFGQYMKAVTRNTDEIFSVLDLGSKSEMEKAQIITTYVKSNFNWNGYSTKLTSQSIKEFLKTKTGNCSEINLFLCSLLNSLDIKAYPVILSTRDHGKVEVDYPFQQFLNYVIVLVNIDGKKILLDATESLSPFGMLPARCINEKGLVINKEKLEWIPLTDEVNSIKTDSIHIAFNESLDSAFVDVTIQANGHKALDLRRMYFSDKENFNKEHFNADINMRKAVAVENEKEIEKPFKYSYKASIATESLGDRILISPFPGLAIEENPLKVSYRNYPVDMIYPETNNFDLTIDIPSGYKLAELPKEVAIDDALVSITYKAESDHNKVHIVGSYAFKKAVYQKQDYLSLKVYFNNIVKTFNDKIMLVKDV
jgi:transglutaminase-like putative cysteine protease